MAVGTALQSRSASALAVMATFMAATASMEEGMAHSLTAVAIADLPGSGT